MTRIYTLNETAGLDASGFLLPLDKKVKLEYTTYSRYIYSFILR